ncbi:hypothetical protein GQR58_011856 [Nymphon striatum]|nr:hypothetical protein GQR58_011856 [Nymphon striatum]
MPVTMEGILESDVEFDDFDVEHTFYVENVSEPVLGMGFMKLHAFVIDTSTEQLMVKDENVSEIYIISDSSFQLVLHDHMQKEQKEDEDLQTAQKKGRIAECRHSNCFTHPRMTSQTSSFSRDSIGSLLSDISLLINGEMSEAMKQWNRVTRAEWII